MLFRPNNIKDFLIIPLTLGLIAFVGVFGIVAQANNDILVGGKVWEEGMAYWDTGVAVDAGQEFKITLYVSHINADGQAVTNISLADDLPQYTSYVAGSSYQITDAGGAWQAMSDDGTTPFDNGGVSPHGGTLAPFGFANYKYTVKVADFLPTGTVTLPWNGPVFSFTDQSGAQTKGNAENTSISVSNLPNIDSFSTNATSYKLGDTITFTARGTQNKTAYVEFGGKTVSLTSSGPDYTGTYTVQVSDDMANVTPRVKFEFSAGAGSYRDASTSISIDTVAPPSPTGLSSSVDSGTLKATLNWTASSPETDVAQYVIYSNNGSGAVSYSTPLATVPAGTTSYTTSALTADALYTFVVRAQDAAGNTDSNTSSVNAATDFVPPDAPGSLVQPTTLNDTVIKFNASNPIAFSWTASPSADVAQYRIEIDDSSDFSSMVATRETADASTSLSLASADATLPDGVYYWRVSAIDDASNVSGATTSPDNTFEIDTTVPQVLVSAPLSGSHVSGNFTMTGTATDGSGHMTVGSITNGIAKVEVLLTDITNSTHWNGTAWVSGGSFLLAQTADDFANWTYAFTAPITNGHSYVTGARVTDQAGNIDEVDSLISLIGNTTTPTVTITSPSAGNTIGGGVSVIGTAGDPGGTAIADVSLSIQRNSDSQYWNGTAWAASQAWVSATSTNAFANWTYAFNPDFSAADGTVYAVTARATDGVFGTPNTGTSGILNITKDTAVPTVAISSPLAANSPYKASTWDAANPITGTASDATSAIASVSVAVKDSAGNYWNGTDWSSASVVWLSATTSDNFANWAYRPGSADFVPNKNDLFTVYARGTDAALGSANVSAQGTGETVIYDTIAPVVASVTVTDTTISSTTHIKDGDSVVLTATITDAYQSAMTTANISANLSSITGNGGDTAITPTSYDTGAGIATWAAVTAAGTGNGLRAVAVTASDPAANSATQSGNTVADNFVPSVSSSTLATPSGVGVAWAGGSVQTIAWNQASITDTNLASNPITLAYSTDGTNWTSIATNEANDGSYDWTIPSINSNTVTVRITAADQAGNTASDVSDAQFIIDASAPSVSSSVLIAPNGAEAWKQGTAQSITWNNAAVTDNFGLASNPITLAYSTDGTNWTSIATNEANDGSYDWTIPSINSNTVTVRITAADQAGNTASDVSDAQFAIGLPPTVTEVRAVSNTTVQVVWDKALVSAGAFGNYSATGLTVTAAAVNGGDNTIVDVTVNALNNTAFTATDFAISAGTATDADNFANEAVLSQDILDRQKPTIVASKALSLAGTDYLVLTYSEDVATSTAELISNMTLESPTGSGVSIAGSTATYSYTTHRTIIALASSVNLSRTNTYTITVSNVSDLASNAIVTSSQTTGTVVAAGTLTEIVTDPRQDWSGAGFTGTPGGTAAADDRYIEVYVNDAGLNLSNWSYGLSDTPGSEGGSTFSGVAGSIVYTGTGSLSSTAIGDVFVIPIASLSDNKRIRIYEENGIVVDSVALGTFNDGNTSDNAPSGGATAGQVYDEAVSRDTHRTDTNVDSADWHVMRATPGVVDTTAPQANTSTAFPASDQLIVDARPVITIALTESGSGVRNDSGVDSAYADQVVFTLDGAAQIESYDPAAQVVTFTPSTDLDGGKHTISITLRDNAGNTNTAQTWDFWVDTFSTSVTTNAISYRFNGNTTDETDGTEQQQVSVSSFGAAYTVYAKIGSSINDGYGNIITDVDVKQAAQTWTSKVDLSGATLIPVVQVAALGTPSESIQNQTHTFDVRATIPGILQAAGDYAGSLEFVVIPTY